MVLLQQMQEEFIELRKRRTQAQVDSILWQRRERKRIKCKQHFRKSSNYLCFFIVCNLKKPLDLVKSASRKTVLVISGNVFLQIKQMSLRKKLNWKLVLFELQAAKIISSQLPKIAIQNISGIIILFICKIIRVTIGGHPANSKKKPCMNSASSC